MLTMDVEMSAMDAAFGRVMVIPWGVPVWQVTVVLGALTFLWLAKVMQLTVSIRSLARPWVSNRVKQDLWIVLAAQRIQHPFLSQFISFCSLCVSLEFYATFLPFLFWAHYSFLARQLALLMALCLYVGNVMKDVICAPRPPSPPVVRIRNNDNDNTNAQEYGLPSSHTVNTLCLLGYMLVYFVREGQIDGDSVWPYAWGVIALTLFVMYGRLYQGMHSMVDLSAGVLIAAAMLGLWCQVDKLVDSWITTGTNVISFHIVLAVLLCLAYPVPEGPSPSYDYHVAFNGVALGVVIGVHRTFNQFHNGSLDPLPIFTRAGAMVVLKRFLIGLPAMVIAKQGSKALLKAVLPTLTGAFGVPIKVRVSNLQEKESPTRIADFPSSASISPQSELTAKNGSWDEPSTVSKRGLGPPSDLDWNDNVSLVGDKQWVEEEVYNPETGIRLISYASIAWTVTELMPYVFQYLSL